MPSERPLQLRAGVWAVKRLTGLHGAGFGQSSGGQAFAGRRRVKKASAARYGCLRWPKRSAQGHVREASTREPLRRGRRLREAASVQNSRTSPRGPAGNAPVVIVHLVLHQRATGLEELLQAARAAGGSQQWPPRQSCRAVVADGTPGMRRCTLGNGRGPALPVSFQTAVLCCPHLDVSVCDIVVQVRDVTAGREGRARSQGVQQARRVGPSGWQAMKLWQRMMTPNGSRARQVGGASLP